jgi:hypothetical protein
MRLYNEETIQLIVSCELATMTVSGSLSASERTVIASNYMSCSNELNTRQSPVSLDMNMKAEEHNCWEV